MRIAAPDPTGTVERRPRPPTFSILIAAYQVAECIGGAVESALNQTVPAHEVITCDDGSTDELGTALVPFRERIQLIRKENGGEASAKNAAARAASGEFVLFLDADDAYLPERVEALGQLAMERPDLDILTTDAYLESSGEIVRRVYTSGWTFETANQRRVILQRNFVFGHAAVRRKLFIESGGFDEMISHTTDWDYWIRLVLDGSMVGAVLEPLSLYRVREQSLSADRAGMLRGGIQTMSKALHDPNLREEELAVVKDTIRQLEHRLAPLRLREALQAESPEARRLALRLVLGSSASVRTRLKAGLAAVAPGLAQRWISRREAREWVGAGGTTVTRA